VPKACAGLRRRRFFLYLAEFLDAIRPGSFPNMRCWRFYLAWLAAALLLGATNTPAAMGAAFAALAY